MSVVPDPSWKSVGRTSNTSYYLAEPDMLIIIPETGLKDNAASAKENTEFQIALAQNTGRPLGLVVYMTSLL